MKNLFLLFAFALFSLSAFGQGIDFQDLTPEEAIAKAKAESKHVFVDVYTDWCGPCKMMDAQVFPLKEVGDYFNPRFVSIKLNAEKGETGPAFANKFGVKAYPTFLILDGDGNLVHMFAGGILDITFIDKVDVAFDSKKAFGALKKRYDAGEQDKKFMATYIQALQNTHTIEVTKMVEEFYATLSDEEKVFEEALFIFEVYAPFGSDKEKFMTENRDKFREVAGREKVDSILKMKYVMHYSKILQGYDRRTTKEEIEKIGNKAASIELLNASILSAYQAAAIAKVLGTGEEALRETIKTAVSNVSDREKDIFLYFVIPAFRDVWSKEQKDELIELVSDESTKGYIIRSANR